MQQVLVGQNCSLGQATVTSMWSAAMPGTCVSAPAWRRAAGCSRTMPPGPHAPLCKLCRLGGHASGPQAPTCGPISRRSIIVAAANDRGGKRQAGQSRANPRSRGPAGGSRTQPSSTHMAPGSSSTSPAGSTGHSKRFAGGEAGQGAAKLGLPTNTAMTAPARNQGPAAAGAALLPAAQLSSLSPPGSTPSLISPWPKNMAAWGAIMKVVAVCEAAGAAYCLRGRAAALAQGVCIEDGSSQPGLPYQVEVQWDQWAEVQAGCKHAFGIPSAGPATPVPCGSAVVVAVPLGKPSTEPAKHGAAGSALPVLMTCTQAAVVACDPHRVLVEVAGTSSTAMQPMQVWAQSLWALRQAAEQPNLALMPPVGQVHEGQADPDLAAAVTARLREAQLLATQVNSAAWAEGDTYAAWVARFGQPEQAAAWVRADPAQRLGPVLLAHLAPGWLAAQQASLLAGYQQPQQPSPGPSQGGPVQSQAPPLPLPQPLAGQRVANLMGSHGLKALAAALLGAQDVAVVDVSPGNARYAREVAAAAGLPLNYMVADVLDLAPPGKGGRTSARAADEPGRDAGLAWGQYDWVLMEQGILHYFVDLRPLLHVIHMLLAPGRGRLLLRDFHPVSTKLISSKGAKHKVTGDYFASGLAPTRAAFAKYQQAAAGHSAASKSAAPTGELLITSSAADASDPPGVLLRRWGLGEVVSEVGAAGLVVEVLEEEQGPKADDRGLPKGFLVVARRPA